MSGNKTIANPIQPTIAVIGAGIMGLACVVELLEAGFRKITIYAEKITPYTTSDVAAAVCETQKSYLEPENTWYQNNLIKLNQLLSVANSGISKINYMEIHKNNSQKQDANYVCKKQKNIILVNTKHHIRFLMDTLHKNDIAINEEKITHIQQLTPLYDIVINCTGLGSRELLNDTSIYPVRGQIVIFTKPKELDECIAELTENMTYIIPRDDDCILGGTEEINNWNLDPDERTSQLIIERAQKICPSLKNEKLINVKVGLRPVRDRIRLETEKIHQRLVIHNYGHGGEGYSFAWGCAKAIKDIISKEYS